MGEYSAGKKLIILAGVCVALAVVLGASAFWVVNNLSGQLDRAVNVNAHQQNLAGQIASASSDLVAMERGVALAVILQQGEQAGQMRRDLGQVEAALDEHLRKLRASADNVLLRPLLDKLNSEFEGFRGLHRQVEQKLEAQKMDEALGILNTSLLPKLVEMSRSAKQLLDLEQRELAALSQAAASTRAVSVGTLSSICLLVLGVGVAVSINLRSIYGALGKAVRELNEYARTLSQTAQQVSSSSQSVSQAASEQAASLEETSASADQIHAMTQRNTEHSELATTSTQETSRVIGDANRALDQMVVSMNEISASSNKISKIIKVIDDIAFQTNILALNAAVEAARAGEAGMGFAVVADEVRSLAQRSAQAAKDTTELIEESIGRASEGKQKLDEVAQAIASVTGGATKVRNLVEQVHSGSGQQAKGIEQIARAVSRMEQVTQQLAATAEQSAAAGQELNQQARAVDEIGRALERLVGSGGGEVARELRPPARTRTPVPPKVPAPVGARSHRPPGATSKFDKPQPVMASREAEEMIPFEEEFKEF